MTCGFEPVPQIVLRRAPVRGVRVDKIAEVGLPTAVIENLLKFGCRFVGFAQSQVSLATQVVGPELGRAALIWRARLQKLDCPAWLIVSKFDSRTNYRDRNSIYSKCFGITFRQLIGELLGLGNVTTKRAVWIDWNQRQISRRSNS